MEWRNKYLAETAWMEKTEEKDERNGVNWVKFSRRDNLKYHRAKVGN